MTTLQEFVNYGIWICDWIAIVLLVNYIGRSIILNAKGNAAMATAFLLYIGGHTISRTWVIFTHKPILYSSGIDITSSVIATIGLIACIRMFSIGSSLWLWIVVGATVLAALLATLM